MNLLHEFSHLFFPKVCLTCGDRLLARENYICLQCIFKLPKTNNFRQPDNALEILMAGRFPFERIASFCHFTKGGVLAPLIYHLKYKNCPEVGTLLGEIFGEELIDSIFMQPIDLIIPVPLHPKKQKQRGYNQAEKIGNGIANATKIPISIGNLVRTIYTPTQTKLDKSRRWENVKEIFDIKHPEKLDNKHILLVDDVITTGSTLEACAMALKKCSNLKISIATIGQAD